MNYYFIFECIADVLTKFNYLKNTLIYLLNKSTPCQNRKDQFWKTNKYAYLTTELNSTYNYIAGDGNKLRLWKRFNQCFLKGVNQFFYRVLPIFMILSVFEIFIPLEYVNANPGRAVWQDNDRNHRRSPSQIKSQLKVNAPRVREHSYVLNSDAHNERAAKTKNYLVDNTKPSASDTSAMLSDGDWRLKILPAAITNTRNVLLGDIARPLGNIDEKLWVDLKMRELWPAPPEEGKPLQINKTKLSQVLREALGSSYSGRCILPTSLVIQLGGAVIREDDLRNYVMNSLSPQLAAMPGEAELSDFRLPEYIFLSHTGQQVQLEPGKLTPGRVPLRFAIQEADGTVLRRISGTARLSLWITAPAASKPLNKGETLTPDSITFMRVNAAQMKEMPWDGQGGPWQVVRSIGKGETILQSDLGNKMMARRGNILTLQYKRGNLRMTLQVEALADGAPGETIPVRNLQTKKQVYATVRDGGTVEIN